MTAGSMLDQALAYAAEGFRVFPLVPRGKVPLIAKADGGNGCLDATTDGSTIRRWWIREPAANIGIATGDGLLVVDVDGDEGAIALDALCRQHGDLPVTRCSVTGRKEGGGFHFLFAATGPAVRATKLGPARETRGNGGYIVAGGSIHGSGRRYEMNDAPIADAPAWLPALIAPKVPERRCAPTELCVGDNTTPYGRTALERECEKLRAWPDGDRNNQLNRSAFSLGQLEAGGEIAWDEAGPVLENVALSIGLGAVETRESIDSGLTAGRVLPRKAPERERPRRPSSTSSTTRAVDTITRTARDAATAGDAPALGRILTALGGSEDLASSDTWGAAQKAVQLARAAAERSDRTQLREALAAVAGAGAR